MAEPHTQSFVPAGLNSGTQWNGLCSCGLEVSAATESLVRVRLDDAHSPHPDLAHAYTYSVWFSPEDEQYVATVSEFSSLSWLARTPEGALRGLVELVAAVVDDLRCNDQEAPLPTWQQGVRHRPNEPGERS